MSDDCVCGHPREVHTPECEIESWDDDRVVACGCPFFEAPE